MRRRTMLLTAALALLVAGGVALGQSAGRLYLPELAGRPAGPQVGGCAVFPPDNAWNRDISGDPVDPRSDAYIAAINAGGRERLHPDFGSNPEYGIPYIVVPAGQPELPIEYVEYPEESDPGPFPIPADAPVEGGPASDGDRHVLAVRQGECVLYELYHARYVGPGWEAGSGAVWDLRVNATRPEGWTSADAAGLPILPGLARYDEVTAGEIRHALRFTVWRSQDAYVPPASHAAGATDDPNYPPMGLRLRLKADYDLSGVTGQSRVILEALKRYGMIVADNGSSWFISGASDPRWDDDDLNQIKRVPASAFEVVQSGPITRP
jgi:hypothetical protein